MQLFDVRLPEVLEEHLRRWCAPLCPLRIRRRGPTLPLRRISLQRHVPNGHLYVIVCVIVCVCGKEVANGGEYELVVYK